MISLKFFFNSFKDILTLPNLFVDDNLLNCFILPCFNNSKQLFIQANELIIDQLELIIKELPKLSSEDDSFISISSVKEDIIYKLIFQGYDDTIGNIIQSHIAMKMISEESVLATCGYKKKHPLEEIIHFHVSLNQKNKIFKSNNQQKIIAIIQTFQEACGDLIQIYSTILT